MSEPTVTEITLIKPITVDGETISTVTMREAIVSDHLEAADMAGPNASNARYEACLLSQLTDIPFGVFVKMPEANYFKLMQEYQEMGKSQSAPMILDAPVSSSASNPDND